MHEQASSHPSCPETDKGRLAALSLAALGVVFGDIGTSPLYAMKECFRGEHGVAPTPENVLGILSLIFWSLAIVISIKYLVFILRADHRGEGGILALSVLVSHVKPARWLALLGLFGAALLYSDGMITPAISVLSAVEGLRLAAPHTEPYIVPITVAILVGLFLMQCHGTTKIGRLFGPITLVWFLVIGLLGLAHAVREPRVFISLNPTYAFHFFTQHGWHGFIVLGAVFLVVTGGEALYADIGHFGVKPIRLVWFSVVLPALVFSYLGQGALLLRDSTAAGNPFFALAPSWGLIPLVILASSAAVIASQALITGSYSLTMHAVHLGYSPRLTITHTSPDAKGQIYLPFVNWLLMISCIGLVLGFRSSDNLAAAYGVSITSTMTITTILFYIVARWKWKWSIWRAGTICGLFLAVDLAFFGANILKVANGGWFPLLVAIIVFAVMTTWHRGRALLSKQLEETGLSLETFLAEIQRKNPARVPGTAYFMAANPAWTPRALLHNLKHNKVLHQRIVILNVRIEEVPHICQRDRLVVERLDWGFWRIILKYGFMDEPNVPEALTSLTDPDLAFQPCQTSFFLGRETVLATHRPGMAKWRESLFAWMAQNARDATSFFRLTPNCVVELGEQVEI